MEENTSGLAKLIWTHPQTKEEQEFVLIEGATASIGRLADNDICIPEHHVSRRHAVISYDEMIGAFMVKDAGSSNGTFVNDKEVAEPALLMHGDIIRLYVPTLKFSAVVTEADRTMAAENGTLITAVANTGKGKLIITTGPQEGNTIPLLLNELTVGRATSRANWEIALQDPSVSRPHARLELHSGNWHIIDLESANGTLVNGKPVIQGGQQLRDGDIVAFGATLALFRVG
jgi:pSer/pThr/pTyr-binding forkhead associated (FHA) protein